MPDFDIDFCMDGRDRVIDYVIARYGSDRVSQIITFGTMAAKAVVRDAGRVLGLPFPFVDMIAKLIPFDLGITLDRALAEEAPAPGPLRTQRGRAHPHRSRPLARRAHPQRGPPRGGAWSLPPVRSPTTRRSFAIRTAGCR